MSFDLKAYFEEINRDDYQREDFDDFLKKVNFKYNVPSIHIAGSNGKGSTANYLARIYRAYGLKVGLFTSPALNKVNAETEDAEADKPPPNTEPCTTV